MDEPAAERPRTHGAEGPCPEERELLKELRFAKTVLDAQNESLSVVTDLVFRLQQRLDVEAIARETVEALQQYRHPPLVAFYLLERPEGPLRLVAGAGFTEKERELGATLPLEGSASGRAVREQRIVPMEEVVRNGRDVHPVVSELASRSVTSGLCIPLSHGGTPLGTINVIFPNGREIRPVEERTFHGIARAVSLAVSNSCHLAGIEHLAFHDALTGLPNRPALHRRLAPPPSGFAGDQAAGLVLLDLDRFREINDALGHNVGDDLLVQVAERLVARRDGQREDVFRLGGDEFAVLVPGARSLAELDAEARAILAALEEPVKVAGMGLEVGASAGFALLPEQARTSHELLRCADVALHRAKQTPGGAAAYARELDEHTPERLAMLSELGRAIRDGQLVLHFQPKVALQYGFVEGFEALVRWNHPRLGLLPSSRFVPFAEATDLVQPLTAWVVRSALEQLARWNRQMPRLTMAVNLSMRNVLDRSCPETLAGAMKEVGVDPGVVEFELTETAIMADPTAAQTSLGRITSLGARLAIDDFGTGYSSLSYLARLPVDVLKIDRSFLADLAPESRNLAVVRSTVQLAHALELGVVAEGIEDRETARALRDMRCDLGQGFYFARPEPAEEAGRHVARGGWIDVPV